MTKKTENTEEVITKCFKFKANTLIGGVLHLQDSCIKLNPDDLGEYAPYVYQCTGNKEKKDGPCVKC